MALGIQASAVRADNCSAKYALVYYSDNGGGNQELLEFYMTACWDLANNHAYGTSQSLVNWTHSSYEHASYGSTWYNRNMANISANNWVAFDFNVYLEEIYWNLLHPRVYYTNGVWYGCADAGGSILTYRSCSFSSTYQRF